MLKPLAACQHTGCYYLSDLVGATLGKGMLLKTHQPLCLHCVLGGRDLKFWHCYLPFEAFIESVEASQRWTL